MQWTKTSECRYESACGSYTMKKTEEFTILREVKGGVTKYFILPTTSENLYTSEDEPKGDVTKLMWAPLHNQE